MAEHQGDLAVTTTRAGSADDYHYLTPTIISQTK